MSRCKYKKYKVQEVLAKEILNLNEFFILVKKRLNKKIKRTIRFSLIFVMDGTSYALLLIEKY